MDLKIKQKVQIHEPILKTHKKNIKLSKKKGLPPKKDFGNSSEMSQGIKEMPMRDN